MPMPTTVTLVRAAPAVAAPALADALAAELARLGMRVVRTGPDTLRFAAPLPPDAPIGVAGPPTIGFIERGEIELSAAGPGCDVSVDVRVSRIPAALAGGAAIGSAMMGGLDGLSIGAGLLIGAAIAFVPWWLARRRIRRVILAAERTAGLLGPGPTTPRNSLPAP